MMDVLPLEKLKNGFQSWSMEPQGTPPLPLPVQPCSTVPGRPGWRCSLECNLVTSKWARGRTMHKVLDQLTKSTDQSHVRLSAWVSWWFIDNLVIKIPRRLYYRRYVPNSIFLTLTDKEPSYYTCKCRGLKRKTKSKYVSEYSLSGKRLGLHRQIVGAYSMPVKINFHKF
jgi:hypothetical protein